MARVSRPLVLSEADIHALNELKAYGDKETSLRAEIVIACAENRTNKSIAQELSVAEATVKKWKEAFREHGLQGLSSEHNGGRKPTSPTPSDLEKSILSILDESTDENLTAATLAEQLSVDVSKVYYVLRKNGIHLSRNRKWEYISRDNMADWNPPVLCLYLSSSCTILVASSKPWQKENHPAQGVLVTHSKALKEELKKSLIPVSLIGLLKTARRMPDETSVGTASPGRIIEEAIMQWDVNKEAEFFIFHVGDDFAYKGSRAKQCHLYHYESMEEMKTSFLHWMGARCNGSQHSEAEFLLEECFLLHQKQQKSTHPFVWYLKQNAEDDGESVVTDTIETKEGVLVLPSVTNWNSVEEMLDSILPEMDSSEPMTEAGAVLFQRGNDGKLQYRLVRGTRKFQAMEEFSFETKEGFERDLSRLEEDTEAFLQGIASANYELFIDGSKKNKT